MRQSGINKLYPPRARGAQYESEDDDDDGSESEEEEEGGFGGSADVMGRSDGAHDDDVDDE